MNSKPHVPSLSHYQWAGLDFILDQDGVLFFLEANRSTHMLWEFVAVYGHGEPFHQVASWMNAASGPPCVLWRRRDPNIDDVENAGWVGSWLSKFLNRAPLVAYVEDNQTEREELLTREGNWILPGSLFRWWYPLPWSLERSGVRVVNPNSVWLVVRDKMISYEYLARAEHFRVPWSAPVRDAAEAAEVIALHPERFGHGFVLKPRIGFGGHGVQVGPPGGVPREVPENGMVSERIVPNLRDGLYWDIRVFVMGGRYCGGLIRTSAQPVTNVFQGGKVHRLPDDLEERLGLAAVEAVQILDEKAAAIHRLPDIPDSHLTRVTW
jgi:hypothetical protein